MKQTISLILSLFLFTSTICVAQTDGKSLAIEGLKYYNGKVVEKIDLTAKDSSEEEAASEENNTEEEK